MNIIGDVKDRKCIIVDDMVDSGGTLANAAKAIMDKGAESILAYASHGVLSGKAHENMTNSVLTELVVTDSIPFKQGITHSAKIRQITVAPLIGEAIRRISNEESVSILFK
jgi:ribose-phosphate pyrophosphokinase